MNNNTHPCAGKCSEFKEGGQCFHCLINETVNRGVYSMHRTEHRIDLIVQPNDMGDDAHIENHISPLIERLKVENVVLQAKVDELQKRLDAVKLDLSIFSDFIKRFDANTDTATIVGTMYGFVDELEQSLGGEA